MSPPVREAADRPCDSSALGCGLDGYNLLVAYDVPPRGLTRVAGEPAATAPTAAARDVRLQTTEAPSAEKPKEHPIDRFEKEILALEQQPRPTDGSTIFFGSSTMVLWDHFKDNFKEFNAYNLGFGGSTVKEIDHYFDRLTTGFTPGTIVIYAGPNDMGQDHHSGQQVAKDSIELADHAHNKFPNAQVLWVSSSVCPAWLDRQADYDTANNMIHEYSKDKPWLRFVDVTHLMPARGSEPFRHLFLNDNTHMTPEGYAKWLPEIKDALAHPWRFD